MIFPVQSHRGARVGAQPLRCAPFVLFARLTRLTRLGRLGRLGLVVILAAGCVPVAVRLGAANLVENGDASQMEIAYGPGARQRYDVYRPVDAKGLPLAGPRPVVIFIHGGSWESGSKEAYAWVGQSLALQGYVAVLPNYGLMPTTHFPGFVEDAARAVADAHARMAEWGGDPTRFYLMGHSAGAQIAALLAYDTHYLGAHGMAAGSVAGFIGLSGPYDFVYDTPLLRRTFGGTPAEERAAQPIAFVDRQSMRTLLVMGRQDRTVDPRNTRSLADRLMGFGVSVDTLWVDGEHGVSVGAFARPYRSKSVIVPRVRAFIE